MQATDTERQPLAGKIALVTGATRGIGRACALALAGAGAHVIAVGRTQGALEALDDELVAAGYPRPTLVPMDLADGDNIDVLGHEIWRLLKQAAGTVDLHDLEDVNKLLE